MPVSLQPLLRYPHLLLTIFLEKPSSSSPAPSAAVLEDATSFGTGSSNTASLNKDKATVVAAFATGDAWLARVS